MPKIIIIEGLPGSGKSTTAQYIFEQLKSSKSSCVLLLESSENNPLRYQSGTSESTNVETFLQAIIFQWKSFISENNKTDKLFIIEGMTFQQQVNFLTWINKQDKILPLVKSIQKLLAQCDSHLIYFSHQNPVLSMRHTLEVRGKDWVNEKVLPISNSPFALERSLIYPEAFDSFILEIQKINNELFANFPQKKTQIDITDQKWKRIQLEIMSAL